MFTQSTSQKRKPRKFPDSVIQGSRILGQTGGRPAQMYRNEKSSGICPAESPLEKTVGQLAALDPCVRTVHPQPFTIDIVTGFFAYSPEELKLHRKMRERAEARLRDYTPDFCFELTDGQRIVVEVKDPRFPCAPGYWEKVEQAKELLRSNGYGFQIISIEYEPSAPLVHNADLLSAASVNFNQIITRAQIDAIEANVGDTESTLGYVAQLAGLSLREAPALVLRGVVAADISAGLLGACTPVRLAYGELKHFSILNLQGDVK